MKKPIYVVWPYSVGTDGRRNYALGSIEHTVQVERHGLKVLGPFETLDGAQMALDNFSLCPTVADAERYVSEPELYAWENYCPGEAWG
jgi:hypothetical protein